MFYKKLKRYESSMELNLKPLICYFAVNYSDLGDLTQRYDVE